jgi:hypothetical protein
MAGHSRHRGYSCPERTREGHAVCLDCGDWTLKGGDVFLIEGPALANARQQIQLENDLLAAMQD